MLRGAGEKADLCVASYGNESPMFNEHVMEKICNRDNLQAALRRVKRNKGSAGIEGMRVDELPAYLKTHRPAFKALLLCGEYDPPASTSSGNPQAGKVKREA